MIFFFGGLALAVFGMFAAAMLARRSEPREVALLPDLAPRLAAATTAFGEAVPWIPATVAGAPEGAAAIEAALIAGDADKALAAAESAMAAAPDSASTRVWLAWALCASGEPQAAIEQIEAVRPGLGDGTKALALYVEARARHLAFEHTVGATGATPPLVTMGDVTIVTLAGTRGGSAWLAGAADVKIPKEDLAVVVAEHRTATARSLALALDALDAAPGFANAAYLAARLAVKSGAVGPGRAMFEAVAPRIAGRPDADALARDLADLEDPSAAVAAAMQPAPPPTPPTAKRSRSLKVLK